MRSNREWRRPPFQASHLNDARNSRKSANLLRRQVANQQIRHQRSRLRSEPVDRRAQDLDRLATSVLEHHPILGPLDGQPAQGAAVFGLGQVSGECGSIVFEGSRIWSSRASLL
jgi:hypothetical protein